MRFVHVLFAASAALFISSCATQAPPARSAPPLQWGPGWDATPVRREDGTWGCVPHWNASSPEEARALQGRAEAACAEMTGSAS